MQQVNETNDQAKAKAAPAVSAAPNGESTRPNFAVDKHAVELFAERIRKSGPQVAMRWKEGQSWREATWGDWDRASREIAGGLRSLGVVTGDRVCILANTRPEWLECDVGILMAGAITVPIYQSNVPHECEYIINDAGAKLVFIEDPLQLEKLYTERDQLKDVVRVVYYSAESRLEKPDAKGRIKVTMGDVIPAARKEADKDWIMSLADLQAAGKAWLGQNAGALDRVAKDEITTASSFTFVYTSGTTGPPKGVVLTHANIVWELNATDGILPLKEGDEQLLFLPMAHIFAKILEWTSIARGGKIAFAESIAKIRDNLGEVRPDIMCAVPRVLEKMYLAILGQRNASPPTKQKVFDWAFSVGKKVAERKQQKRAVPLLLGIQYSLAERLVFHKIRAILGGRIQYLVSGGAPLSKEIAEFFAAAGLLILEGWGLTETTAGTCINRPDNYAFGTVGPPIPGAQVRIAADGEILVRAGSVMKEYYNKPEATREAIDGDGWFHTGDIGVFDDAGRLRITDRKKDLIVNSGGKNIAPQNLENALKATPFISQVMVHGDKRPYLVALVTLNEENVKKWAEGEKITTASWDELAKHDAVRKLIQGAMDELNRREPSYSAIKKFTILAHDFSQETGELTPTLKVKRKFTGEKYQSYIDALYQQKVASAD